MLEGIRRSIARWVAVEQQAQIDAQQRHIKVLEAAVRSLVYQAAPAEYEVSLRKDVAALEQRLDALCQVCGVEVVITDNEVFTAEISPSAVERVQKAAAVWMLIKETEEAKLQLIRAMDRVQTALRRS